MAYFGEVVATVVSDKVSLADGNCCRYKVVGQWHTILCHGDVCHIYKLQVCKMLPTQKF